MNGHGGSRAGAGRKASGANKMHQAARESALASGQSPLDFMLEVMRDAEEDRAKRLDAAKAAAPYLHARLTAIEHSGDVGLHHESWLDEIR